MEDKPDNIEIWYSQPYDRPAWPPKKPKTTTGRRRKRLTLHNQKQL